MSTQRYFRHESATATVTVWGDGTATISNLYSEHTGRGHATGLMNLITETADRDGFSLVLHARQYGNPRGLSNFDLVLFYKRFGFELVSLNDKDRFMRRLSQEKPGP